MSPNALYQNFHWNISYLGASRTQPVFRRHVLVFASFLRMIENATARYPIMCSNKNLCCTGYFLSYQHVSQVFFTTQFLLNICLPHPASLAVCESHLPLTYLCSSGCSWGVLPDSGRTSDTSWYPLVLLLHLILPV